MHLKSNRTRLILGRLLTFFISFMLFAHLYQANASTTLLNSKHTTSKQVYQALGKPKGVAHENGMTIWVYKLEEVENQLEKMLSPADWAKDQQTIRQGNQKLARAGSSKRMDWLSIFFKDDHYFAYFFSSF